MQRLLVTTINLHVQLYNNKRICGRVLWLWPFLLYKGGEFCSQNYSKRDSKTAHDRRYGIPAVRLEYDQHRNRDDEYKISNEQPLDCQSVFNFWLGWFFRATSPDCCCKQTVIKQCVYPCLPRSNLEYYVIAGAHITLKCVRSHREICQQSCRNRH